MSAKDVEDQIKSLYPEWKLSTQKAKRLDKWYRGRHDKPTMPSDYTEEYGELQKRSPTPILGLIVTSIAQNLYVDGFREEGRRDDAPSWRDFWLPNSMPGKQIAVHRACLAHGSSFLRILPGRDQMTNAPRIIFDAISALRMDAWYQDPANDTWPMWTLSGTEQVFVDDFGNSKKEMFWELGDENAFYYATSDINDVDRVTYAGADVHGLGVNPTKQFAPMRDIDGGVTGEVEPFITLVSRIDQDVFDRLIVQRFGSWKVRYIAGMEKPATDAEGRAQAMAMRLQDLLVSTNKDTKFGTLDATELKGYIDAFDSDLHTLAAVSQTPPHWLLGQMANLSAEALAAAASSLTSKVDERKAGLGLDWADSFRMGAWITGDRATADSYGNRVVWRDTESRSFVQTATALGVLATQVQIPIEMLWERVPGWTQEDTADAKAIYAKAGGLNALYAKLLASQQKQQSIGGQTSTDVATAKAQTAQ